MPAAHDERRTRLRALLREAELDALLVTSLVNVRYLTGLSSSNAAVLVAPDEVVLATDGRYDTQAGEQAPDVERVIDRDVARVLTERAAKGGTRSLGFEEHVLTVSAHAALAEGAAATLELLPSRQLVETLRTIKDDDELDALRTACAISTSALEGLVGQLAPGRTERDVARELESRMLDEGAESVAFETIVATGANSAVPHHRPTEREITAGDLLKIDFGARYSGYHADCTRTFVVARPPQAWQQEIHDLVRTAQRAGRHALRPGAELPAIDGAARDVIREAGHAEHFGHGLGHGVGLEIHEAPMLGYTAAGTIDARTSVTVEPGVYLPGRGGVRIEDTLVVTQDGAELLTTYPKDLQVV